MLEISAWTWGATVAVAIALLSVDLTLAALRPHRLGFREATAWSLFYIMVAPSLSECGSPRPTVPTSAPSTSPATSSRRACRERPGVVIAAHIGAMYLPSALTGLLSRNVAVTAV